MYLEDLVDQRLGDLEIKTWSAIVRQDYQTALLNVFQIDPILKVWGKHLSDEVFDKHVKLYLYYQQILSL